MFPSSQKGPLKLVTYISQKKKFGKIEISNQRKENKSKKSEKEQFVLLTICFCVFYKQFFFLI